MGPAIPARGSRPLIYWDASAIISAVLEDDHTSSARARLAEDTIHLLSTLSYAEFCAVMANGARDRRFTQALAASAIEAVDDGRWRRVEAVPAWERVKQLTGSARLRGADLWHLATALTLQVQIPELRLLTFDTRLREAAAAHGLAA